MSYMNVKNAYQDRYVYKKPVVENYFENILNDNTPNNIKHHIYIIIPCYNFENYIEECLNSIITQNYDNYTCIIINDGTTDNTLNKINSTMNDKMILLNYKDNKGPAFSKYVGFMKAKELSTPNDIILVLDGDDYLFPDSLSKINNIYCKHKCLFTYGSCEGENCHQGVDNKDINNYRKEKWLYSHPRSFKSILLNFFDINDFKYNDGTWLQKGTDRNFVYKCLELSGKNRIKYINDILYYYRSHQNNTHVKLDKEFRKKQVDYTINQPAMSLYVEPIHILMCSWKRTQYLNDIIKSIQNQDIKNPIIFHIVNNNREENENLTNIVSNYNNNINRKVILYNNNKNLYGYARFLKSRQLRKKYFMEYILFIDDDQVLPSDYVKQLYNKQIQIDQKSY